MSRDMPDSFEFMEGKREERPRFGNDVPARSTREARSDLVDITMALHMETHPNTPDSGAVLLSQTGDESTAIWIPKSQCQVERTGQIITGKRKSGQPTKLSIVTLTLPQWQARNKGLI